MSSTKLQDISIVCPTRGNPELVGELVDNVAATAANPERLHLSFYIDDDDPRLKDYEFSLYELRHRHGDGLNIEFVAGDRIGTPRAINYLGDMRSADIYAIVADDVRYVTPHWDRRIDEIAQNYPDGIFNAWFNDGHFGETLSWCPILGRGWVSALNYLVPMMFEHYVCDYWLHHLGRFTDRNCFQSDIYMSQRESDEDGGDGDGGDEKRFAWQASASANRRMARDNELFKKLERYLRIDAEVLRQEIAKRASSPLQESATSA